MATMAARVVYLRIRGFLSGDFVLPDDSIAGIADPDKHTLAGAAKIPEQ